MKELTVKMAVPWQSRILLNLAFWLLKRTWVRYYCGGRTFTRRIFWDLDIITENPTRSLIKLTNARTIRSDAGTGTGS